MRFVDSIRILIVAATVIPATAYSQGLLSRFYELLYPKSWDCGSASITDHGPLASYNRYIVEVANISLGEEGDYAYSLCRLPSENLTIGLAIPVPAPAADRLDPVNDVKATEIGLVNIRLAFFDDRGQSLGSHEGRLKDEWIWGFGPTSPEGAAFVYWYELVLTPDEARTYSVRLSVSPTADRLPVDVRLIGHAGGWK